MPDSSINHVPSDTSTEPERSVPSSKKERKKRTAKSAVSVQVQSTPKTAQVSATAPSSDADAGPSFASADDASWTRTESRKRSTDPATPPSTTAAEILTSDMNITTSVTGETESEEALLTSGQYVGSYFPTPKGPFRQTVQPPNLTTTLAIDVLVGVCPQLFLGTSVSGYVTHVHHHCRSNSALCTVKSVAEDSRLSPASSRAANPNGGHLVLPSRDCMHGFAEILSWSLARKHACRITRRKVLGWSLGQRVWRPPCMLSP